MAGDSIGMIYVTERGRGSGHTPQRDLPETYGNWKNVHRRF